ncbi:MAG: tRNA (adenosine(37)-N6)-threonylcarbamoyltransferase complex ATPase subunit type 1 TsaE [Clostridiales bacterium]|jgi:tRNA threonylcarbamoyladenosine biosynthesis protein TsaE|nr:tRNA (adenosine(37)-N6)-threonylcarbamoyltransferase complex ATPase subunit type 1 TsaE [Clostridiales bacterium]
MEVYETRSEEETKAVAEKIARNARPGQVYGLSGEMAAGKTIFAKGFARGLGVSDTVVSPTFTLINEYTGVIPFYHFDVWRLDDPAETLETGFWDYVGGGGVCLIEWAEKVREMAPWTYFITITKISENHRRIEVVRYDDFGA